MAAPIFNLTGDDAIDQGSKYSKQFAFKTDGSPRDFSGLAARAMVRQDFSDAAAILTFVATIPTPETQGIVQIDTDAVTTAALEAGLYKYDIELYDPGDPLDVERLVKGDVEITAEVTK